ncbi:hypothetical protein [Lewinella sp. IMCC34191]|uniref:hypothetical protein n=1 Tax=Lewinella sp. IMCC34191 TaxID=2259172 RepID=UPI000E23AA22|nr:hypothetical protein [Lewinella sp. IMCC34191]
MPQTFTLPRIPFFSALPGPLRFLLLISTVCLASLLRAGDQHDAYYTLTEQNNTVEVLAEIPRTTDAALVGYNPTYLPARGADSWSQQVERSLREHLLLYGPDGKALPLQRMEQVAGDGQYASYRLVYGGGGLTEIRNTVLCDRYPDQVSHHFLAGDAAGKTFSTSAKQPSVRLADPAREDYRWMGLLLFPFLYLFWPVVLSVLD